MRYLDVSKFGIRRSRKVATQGGLCSTVITPEGYVNITFNRELVRRAGKALERGISQHDPAFMELVQVGGYWIVYVRYVSDLHPMYRKKLIWMEERPQWSKNSKKIDRKQLEQGEDHDSDPRNAQPGSGADQDTGATASPGKQP